MGKRGPKPKRIISERWSSNLAYAVGLLATDGCMSQKGHLIDLTSIDREQLENFSKCLGVPFYIGKKSGSQGKGTYLRIQFKNVIFYNFLLSIGLTPAKSKTIGALKIPQEYFWDFLRGSFDGDGCSYSYWDKRWKSSFMFYTTFASASEKHIVWLRETIEHLLSVRGHLTHGGPKQVLHQLKYAKAESLKLLRKMYQEKNSTYLSRKRLKIDEMLRIVGEKL